MSTFFALRSDIIRSAKKVPFLHFDRCQKNGAKWNARSAWAFLRHLCTAVRVTWLHSNLAPCYIMEYFESNVDVIRRQVKANRTYTEISNLFKQNFPEVRRGFSERNLRLFCSKNGITKMNGAEVDAIIQQ